MTMKNTFKLSPTPMEPRPVFPGRRWRHNWQKRFDNCAPQEWNRLLPNEYRSENANYESECLSRTKPNRHRRSATTDRRCGRSGHSNYVNHDLRDGPAHC